MWALAVDTWPVSLHRQLRLRPCRGARARFGSAMSLLLNLRPARRPLRGRPPRQLLPNQKSRPSRGLPFPKDLLWPAVRYELVPTFPSNEGGVLFIPGQGAAINSYPRPSA